MTLTLYLEPSKLNLIRKALGSYLDELDEKATRLRLSHGPRDERFRDLDSEMESVLALIDELNEI